MKGQIRVRFAPSPTGHLHIGSLRTALFNYLFAKSHNGKFILRIEDTDRDRLVPEAMGQIIESLEWIGIEIDEGPKQNGKFGPYVQSERVKIYQDIARKLVEKKMAYYSHSSNGQLDNLRNQAIKAKKPFVYRQIFEPETKPKGDNYPIRFKIPSGQTVWKDIIKGKFTTNNQVIDDFIILKADGFPTYNFANVIDDHLMQVTHVIRGDEFVASTAKHVLLYRALGYNLPDFAHLPVILGPDKAKLSKRHGATAVLDYKLEGYLPSALVNFLALLGWNDGTDQEIYPKVELEKKFKLSKVQKSPAVFDQTKLDWMNGEYIRMLDVKELARTIKPYLMEVGFNTSDDKYLEKVAGLDQERLKKFSDAPILMDFFFMEPEIDTKLLSAKDDSSKVKKWLIEAAKIIEKSSQNHDHLQDDLSDLARHLGIKNGQLFYPIRIAITGKTAAPGLFETILTLGIDKSVLRIKKAISLL
ncbi:MAG: glutamate--tRNA ligase [bacterium]|nr:glutamate--tRNA ligase [bacterium]